MASSTSCSASSSLRILAGLWEEGNVTCAQMVSYGSTLAAEPYGGTGHKFCRFHKRGLLPSLPV